VLAVVSFVLATLGVIALAVAVDGFWETTAVLAIGTPVALLLAAWPLALGRGLHAIADIGDDMAFETLSTRASSPY
jgi:hypothetical protein